ncbi:uncharacterized protein LOC111400422 [Olea europaea var. sylvestris]|uniref:uncharacterized protein LOC111400422 n=1 Tax=Olea europaea var. sylvestris TaxID=158386 RepID=UPI000C1CFA4A|nr:uncharacterized protein LOC111400422 [Olea europaea var. sylvestris]
MQQLDAMNDKIRDYLKYACDYIIGAYDMECTYVSPSNQTVFSVNNERILQVDLMSCPHTLVVIAYTKRDAYSYCSYYYRKDAYVNAYESLVYPVGNSDEWRVLDEVEFQIILASNQKRSSGRPTEKRKRSSWKGNQK